MSEERLPETLQLQDSDEVTDPSETIESEDVEGVFRRTPTSTQRRIERGLGDVEYPEGNLLIDPEESEESEETVISSIKSRYDSISSLEREFRTQILTLVARRLRIISYHRERRHQLLRRLSRKLRALSRNKVPRMVDFEIAGITVTAKLIKNTSEAKKTPLFTPRPNEMVWMKQVIPRSTNKRWHR
jgi:hypothetical protein